MFKSFSAMILAAGYGKRMLPLTNKIPKPLIKVNNISLLKNNIDFLYKIGCKKIVINTHYKHNLISDFIQKNYTNHNVKISHEKNILDTAGGVKKAMKLFDDDSIVVTNCDIFWKRENEIDVTSLINNFDSKEECRLLLVEKEKAHGLINKVGDFSLNNNHVKRWELRDQILYYSGFQMISLNILNNFTMRKFSFNDVWDLQIKKNSLYGNLMFSNLYHIGDKSGLKAAIISNT
jgi:MurNAc alpha-1-phosphate uridylyltransferase|tara:strand:+ start:1392 stop:2093 length:702 start_codon:yes stop_codon:yes gene_type:complete